LLRVACVDDRAVGNLTAEELLLRDIERERLLRWAGLRKDSRILWVVKMERMSGPERASLQRRQLDVHGVDGEAKGRRRGGYR
jgi:hypothetical protein